jgi:hypothetical protein
MFVPDEVEVEREFVAARLVEAIAIMMRIGR